MCAVADCPQEAKKAGYCWAHWKRRMRNKPLYGPVRERGVTAWDGLVKSVLAFAEVADQVAEEDAVKAWQRAEQRLREAIRQYNRRKRKRRTA